MNRTGWIRYGWVNWFDWQFREVSIGTVTYWSTGFGKDRTGMCSVAVFMNSRQIWAGHVPPRTWGSRVRGATIEISPWGNPTHTAAESCGIAPTNQASR